MSMRAAAIPPMIFQVPGGKEFHACLSETELSDPRIRAAEGELDSALANQNKQLIDRSISVLQFLLSSTNEAAVHALESMAAIPEASAAPSTVLDAAAAA